MRCLFRSSHAAMGHAAMGVRLAQSTTRRGLKSKGKFSCICLSKKGVERRDVFSFHDFHQMGLHARDLFALNLFDESSTRNYNRPQKRLENRVPFILSPRDNSIIVSLGNVKAIVYKDYILIFNPTKPVVRAWTNNLISVLPIFKDEYPDTPFELIALEMILQELTDMFDRRLRIYSPLVSSLLSNVGTELDAQEGIQKMVPLQDGIQSFEIEVRESRQRLLDLLAVNEDMMGLLLTHTEDRDVEAEAAYEVTSAAAEGDSGLSSYLRDKRTSSTSRKKDRISAELLMEGYVARLSHALNEIIFMQQKMQSRTNMANMVMTLQRNRIMRMNLHTSIAAVSIGTASCVAGIFGMNLVHGFEETEGLFLVAVGAMLTSVLVIHGSMATKIFGWGGDARKIQAEAERVETMKSLLHDMGNIDHAIKIVFNSIDGNERDNMTLFSNERADFFLDNDNSTISKTEFRKLLLHSRGFRTDDEVDDRNIDQHYKAVDKETSRTVDSEVETFFMLLEKNKDGVLDRSELGCK